MSDDVELKRVLLRQLPDVHARFGTRMLERMQTASDQDVERYFAMISTLVSKLEDDDKALKDVLREMAAEYAAAVLLELSR